MANQTNKEILILHGPNLNMLGKREPEIYGYQTLDAINHELTELGKKLGIAVETFQSNHEGELIEKIQQAHGSKDGLIINPAAFTHTSVALMDALLILTVPIIEVHLSNIHKREPLRHKSLVAGVAAAQVIGFGAAGYSLALKGLAELMERSSGQT